MNNENGEDKNERPNRYEVGRLEEAVIAEFSVLLARQEVAEDLLFIFLDSVQRGASIDTIVCGAADLGSINRDELRERVRKRYDDPIGDAPDEK